MEALCVGGESSNKITPGKNKDARWKPGSIWRNGGYSVLVTLEKTVYTVSSVMNEQDVKDSLICHSMTK